MKMNKSDILSALVLGTVLLIAWIVWVSYSYMEAKAFNEVTGQSVSTWEAMYLHLRVDAHPKEEPTNNE